MYQSKDIFYEINRKKEEKMQCQDVKTIVKCCLFFFIWKKKIPCHSASELSFASMLLSGVEIYLYFYLEGHCKRVTAGRAEFRRCWSTRRPDTTRRHPIVPSITSHPVHRRSVPVSHQSVTGMSGGEGGGQGSCHRCSHPAAASFLSPPLKMYSVVSFSCFF